MTKIICTWVPRNPLVLLAHTVFGNLHTVFRNVLENNELSARTQCPISKDISGAPIWVGAPLFPSKTFFLQTGEELNP